MDTALSGVDFGSEVIVKTDSSMKQWPVCRICGSDRIRNIAHIEFYRDYNWPIYDCDSCGCRSTRHDNATYDLLYTKPNSSYSRYIDQAEKSKYLFDRGDQAGLRAELSQTSKYQFILDEVDRMPVDSRILEIGSSRGHLTSYFILSGRKIIGVDVSETAIASARADFGDHFARAGDPSIEGGAPYDIIFHVGTIGCVADPVGLTTYWLGLLRSGGHLLFNAPNRGACLLRDQLWFESAPPPDVVTLFPPGFWRKRFGDVAKVSEHIERRLPQENVLLALRRLMGRKWRHPVPIALKESKASSQPPPAYGDAAWRQLERVLRKGAPWVGLTRIVPSYPTEYGLFVRMVKN
jgi:SAM-dependent methyltransferase